VNVFWVPREARWSHLKANARQSNIGQLVDDAMASIERDNPALKGVLPKDYARPALDKQRLGQLIDLITNIQLADEDSRSRDVLGRVYEYFLAQCALAEGRKGGEFLTPRTVLNLLVEMVEPYRGRAYDPCCGSGGMFVQSMRLIEARSTGNDDTGDVLQPLPLALSALDQPAFGRLPRSCRRQGEHHGAHQANPTERSNDPRSRSRAAREDDATHISDHRKADRVSARIYGTPRDSGCAASVSLIRQRLPPRNRWP